MATIASARTSAASRTGWLIVVTVMVARLLPMSVQTGMFFDGVTYATIARNMAAGVGDFWHPMILAKSMSDDHSSAVQSPTTDSALDTCSDEAFYEHPPLALWLESLFFRAFGDHYWVEKLYSVLTAIGTAALIAALWRLLLRDRPDLAQHAWLPVLLWISIPTWAWLYGSNMLENTLGFFAIASVYASLRAAYSGSRATLGWTLLAAGCALGGVLCKGPVGLFPLATPVLFAIAFRRWTSRQLLAAVSLPLMFAALLGVLLLNAPAYQFLSIYFHSQVEASLASNREIYATRLGHLAPIGKIARELCAPMLIAAGLRIWARWRRRDADVETARLEFGKHRVTRAALYFALLTAASASLPIMISPKQLGHYVAPSYPYYALALAIMCSNAVEYLVNAGRNQVRAALLSYRLRWLCGVLICATVVVACVLAGRPGRDKDVYRDTLALQHILPGATTVNVGSDVSTDWALKSYLARWNQTAINLGAAPRKYCLTLKGSKAPEGYVPLKTDLVRYQLNQRADSTEFLSNRVGDVPAVFRR